MDVCKNRKVKNYVGIKEGSVSGDRKDDFVKMTRWKLTKVEDRSFGGDCSRWLYAQVGLWKWRRTNHFVKKSADSVLKIELLLTMLSNFEREVALKDSAFWCVACLTHKTLWCVYNLMINLIGLACHIVWYIQYLWWHVVGWDRTK